MSNAPGDSCSGVEQGVGDAMARLISPECARFLLVLRAEKGELRPGEGVQVGDRRGKGPPEWGEEARGCRAGSMDPAPCGSSSLHMDRLIWTAEPRRCPVALRSARPRCDGVVTLTAALHTAMGAVGDVGTTYSYPTRVASNDPPPAADRTPSWVILAGRGSTADPPRAGRG